MALARRTPPGRLIGSGLVPQQFQDQYNETEEDYQRGLAGMMQEERGMFRDFGFKGGIGASGQVNFEVDPTANYGQYQTLLRGIGNRLAGNRNERLSRGLGKTGLAKARENLLRFMAEGDRSQLLGGFQRGAAGIHSRRGEALTQRNRRFGQLENDALDWWSMNSPDDYSGFGPEGGATDPNAAGVDPYADEIGAGFMPGVGRAASGIDETGSMMYTDPRYYMRRRR